MKAREWLSERELAIAGSKGKFSFRAIAALNEAMAEGMTFDDWDENGRIPAKASRVVKVKEKRLADPPRKNKPNDFNAMEVINTHGMRMVLEYCAAGHTLRRCNCEVIKAPSHINAVQMKLITR